MRKDLAKSSFVNTFLANPSRALLFAPLCFSRRNGSSSSILFDKVNFFPKSGLKW